jgi:hypothetical protein
MKKFAIGCAIVLVVLIVLGGIAGYVIWSKVGGSITGITKFTTSMQQVAEIEKQVKNTSSFTAPDNGELTEEMVSRFMKVQEHIQSKLGKRVEDFKTTYDKLDKTLKAEKRDASFTEAMGALGDLASLLVDAKKAQVEGLNQVGFSIKEYDWIRVQAYAAVGVLAGSFDMTKFADQVKAGKTEGLSSTDKESLPDVPEKNKALVAPYEKQLKEWAPLAFFGF